MFHSYSVVLLAIQLAASLVLAGDSPALCAVAPKTTLCIGHRGLPHVYPENTVASLEAAIRAGADAVESDVRLTSDSEVVMMHDLTLDRTTNGTGTVRERPWHGYVEHLRAGGSEPVPRFRDVLDLLTQHRDVFMIIDIKDDNDIEIVDAIAYEVATHPDASELSERLVIGVWSSEFRERAAIALPNFSKCGIGENATQLLAAFFDHVDSYSVEYTKGFLADQAAFVRRVRAADRAVYVWTVNDERDIREIVRAGVVDAVLTDFAPRCLRVRARERARGWRTMSRARCIEVASTGLSMQPPRKGLSVVSPVGFYSEIGGIRAQTVGK